METDIPQREAEDDVPEVDPAEMKAWVARWKIINEMEIRELRRTSPAEKLRGLAALMASAHVFSSPAVLMQEEKERKEARARWQRVRRAGGV